MADSKLDWPAIRAAARLLEQGSLVAFPTETVYGLGADAESPAAVAKIYQAKGRPANHPLIVHIAPEADLSYWAQEVPDAARRLIKAFWPGPLTLILKRAAQIPDAVAGGQDSIGLRSPAHPLALALLREFRGGRGGIAAPSANRFGHVSPTTAQHVIDEFGADHPLIGAVLDGGPSEVGIESTIIDLSRISTHGAVLLRPGRLAVQEIELVLGMRLHNPDSAAPRASGTLDAHYAPATPVVLVPGHDIAATLQKLAQRGKVPALMTWSTDLAASANAAIIRMPATAPDYARELYASLRELDNAGADLIVVETPPAQHDWDAVNDRLRRSAFDSGGVLDRLLGS